MAKLEKEQRKNRKFFQQYDFPEHTDPETGEDYYAAGTPGIGTPGTAVQLPRGKKQRIRKIPLSSEAEGDTPNPTETSFQQLEKRLQNKKI